MVVAGHIHRKRVYHICDQISALLPQLRFGLFLIEITRRLREFLGMLIYIARVHVVA